MNVAIFLLFFAISIKVSTSVADDKKSHRLPNVKINVDSYHLKIIPDLTHDFTFKGGESVIVKILEETKCVTMNSKNLIIKEIIVTDTHRNTIYDVSYKLLPDEEMLQMCFSKVVPRCTTITISISFMGKMRDDFKGLYKVQYEENGSKRWLAATALEPTYARMVFPCFDEPQYNAQFFLSIARYSDQSSSSITYLTSTSEKDPQVDNRVWDNFQKTLPCAPYLMAFAVHSFTSRTDRTGELSINSRRHTDQDVKFIVSDYPKWYNAFTGFLDIYHHYDPYIDLVALPDGDEFSQTATMMIYKENDVFQIEGVDVEKHKEEIAKASIHKIYHLWMGGYVRLHWWSDTWLSESFGIYFQYLFTAELYPMWNMGDRFITEVLQEALLGEEIHPNSIISSPTKLPSEIQNQKFNYFINKKGASIIYMLQQVIGSHLQNAVKETIRKCHKSESDVQPDHLWDAIDNEIKYKNLLPDGTPVKNFMQTWLQNSGFPLITVLTTNRGEVIMKQEMYDSPTTKKYTTDTDYNWITPVSCKKNSPSTHSSRYRVTWLQNSTPTFANYNLDSNEWILCNLKKGYYRVNYSKENWLLLIEQLKSEMDKIDNSNRAQLIDDSFNLAAHNKLSFSIAFNLGTYLKKESDVLPWLSFTKYITYFLKLYEDTDVAEYLKKYFSDIIKHQYERIGFETREKDSYGIKTGRPYILAAACHLGLADCFADSTQIYNTYTNDLRKVPADLKYVVYCSSFEILKDNQLTWTKLWTVYENSQTMSEKELVLSSLACVNDEPLLKRYLEMTISSEALTLFNFEKECIIKSSIRFYKGVTAVLEILEEMIPKLRFQSEQANRTLLLMANEIKFNIVSLEHVEKAKQIVTRLENYGDRKTPLIESLKEFIDLGIRKIDYKIKNSDEIRRAIHDITGYTKPTTATQPPTASIFTQNPTSTDSPKIPSSDFKVTPLMTKYLLIIVGLIFIVI